MKHLLLIAATLGLVSLLSLDTYAVNYTAMPDSDSKAESDDSSAKEKSEEKSEDTASMTFEEKLAEFNGGRSFLTDSRDLFAGKVFDNEGKSIGEIRDIVIGEGGDVMGIIAVLGRLSLGEAYLNAQDMDLEGNEKGYAIKYSKDDVRKVFLDIPKKAPESPEGKILSAKALYKKDVITRQGDGFGRILDLLFSEDHLRVEAAVIEVDFGPVRKRPIAVPIEALNFSQKRTKPIFTIDSKMAAKVMDFAMAQK
ncbi:MAG: PRC-barrel domain-containing protein [Alphaproteobacteria bacterium]|nr:PRC-barrel domain-containing protein [Alphaproteobacteria bacterium]MCB1839478.1 PRC-barrel domain-containing protein [Alphaproteobacteria bacterium]